MNTFSRPRLISGRRLALVAVAAILLTAAVVVFRGGFFGRFSTIERFAADADPFPGWKLVRGPNHRPAEYLQYPLNDGSLRQWTYKGGRWVRIKRMFVWQAGLPPQDARAGEDFSRLPPPKFILTGELERQQVSQTVGFVSFQFEAAARYRAEVEGEFDPHRVVVAREGAAWRSQPLISASYDLLQYSSGRSDRDPPPGGVEGEDWVTSSEPAPDGYAYSGGEIRQGQRGPNTDAAIFQRSVND